MGEENTARLFNRLDDQDRKLTRLLTICEERDKDCARHDGNIAKLKDRIHKVEIDQAKWSALSSIASAVLTAGAIKLFVG